MTSDVPRDVTRCPVHDMPDCSALLNGCSLPHRLAEVYQRGATDRQEQIAQAIEEMPHAAKWFNGRTLVGQDDAARIARGLA